MASRWRTGLGWVLTLAFVVYAIGDWGSADDKPEKHSAQAAKPGELRITSMSDGEVNPGDAVVVWFTGGIDTAPVEATVDGRPAEIVVREPGSVVVRIPDDEPLGKAGLRIVQDGKRSKAWDLHVRATNHKKLIARLLGGLALFVFGLSLLALGVRGLAGHRIRAWLGRLTESPPRAVAAGTLVGALTQLTSSAAAFTVSLVDARMILVAPSVAVLVGAHYGASIIGALLPVQLARESLLVIAIGVMWTRLASTRRGGSIANLVLGTGLMLYGLHLLQTSVEPLVSDPKILPYLEYVRASGVGATLVCAATGALLAFVLQGPGPVYVLVVGLAQTTAALPLANALAILAGTNVGAALAMSIIAWQAGPATRPLASAHLLFGAAATAFGVATIPLWVTIAHAIVPGAHDAIEYGQRVVRTNIAGELAVAFAGAQTAAVVMWLGALPTLIARASTRREPAREAAPEALLKTVHRDLADALERQQHALAIALETSCSGERAKSAESALLEARLLLERRYKAFADTVSTEAIERVARSLVASLQLQRAVEQAVHVAELGVERGVRLDAPAQDRLRDMHRLANDSFAALLTALAEGSSPDLEDAGAREIRLNALEAEGRRIAVLGRTRSDSTSSLRIGLAELSDSYENVGNHLFRVAKSLADDGDEL